ncbi:E3 SUMO-protein ligase ZBED1-like [Saccostrea cucullata]|uniref:E3 SUMO-protein ligase ZBED1-like n=1 Tax=Saccostrea cuccullata TaxID=36930 RepID=UPI002ED51031
MADTIDESLIKREEIVHLPQNPPPSERPTLYGFPGKTKSTVWRDFGFYMGDDGHLDKSHAVCRHCLTAVRYSGNTTNLHTHLARHGHGRSKQPRPLSEVGLASSPIVHMMAKSLSIPSEGENVVTSAQKDVFQPMMSDIFANTQRTSISLNTMIAEYLIESMEIPDAVENSTFVNMMSVADPTFERENCHRFCDSFISQHYEIINHSLSDVLKNCEAVAISYDKWMSTSREYYVTYSVHIVGGTWDLETYNLATNPECVNVKNDLKKMQNKWDIQEPLTVVTSGDFDQSCSPGVQRIHCLAEAINKAARAGLELKNVKDVIKNVCRAQEELVKNFSEDKHNPSSSLQTENLDRQNWLFTFDILTKLMEQKELITLMDKVDDIDCASLCKQLEDMCTVLRPLKSAVDLMCSQTPITASMILPIIKKLQVSLSPEKSDSKPVKHLKETIWKTLYSSYSDPSVRKFLLVASFLDPRYKDLLFVESEERALARDVLSVVATELYRRGTDAPVQEETVVRSEEDGTSYSVILVDNAKDSEPKLKKLKSEEENDSNTPSKSDDWLADVVGTKTSTNDVTKEESVMAEIDQYSTMEQRTTSPFLWWNNRQLIFTTLSRVAKSYLCVPATSSPPDRMYERGHHKYVSQRRLLPKGYVDKLIFLHDNYFKLKN